MELELSENRLSGETICGKEALEDEPNVQVSELTKSILLQR